MRSPLPVGERAPQVKHDYRDEHADDDQIRDDQMRDDQMRDDQNTSVVRVASVGCWPVATSAPMSASACCRAEGSAGIVVWSFNTVMGIFWMLEVAAVDGPCFNGPITLAAKLNP
jgi:hypothetical protein